jgi:hypothetical protein
MAASPIRMGVRFASLGGADFHSGTVAFSVVICKHIFGSVTDDLLLLGVKVCGGWVGPPQCRGGLTGQRCRRRSAAAAAGPRFRSV